MVLNTKIPLRLSYFWNIGFILGITITLQIFTGILLSFFYINNEQESFLCVTNIIENNILQGYIIRIIHINFASGFFIFIYIHIIRNLYFNSYEKKYTWKRGVLILLILILSAFLGYVLPWGQMSFWGASVITSFITVIPYLGKILLYKLWRSYRIGQRMLTLFFSLHFLLPLFLLVITILHLFVLHKEKSNNIIINKRFLKRRFKVYAGTKDLINLFVILLFICFIIYNPFIFDDEENSKIANEIISPVHIKPEWYFLFAYAILRRVPNKLGGVFFMAYSIIVLFLLCYKKMKRLSYYHIIICILFYVTVLLLTFVGGMGVESPYIEIGQILLLIYFGILIII